MEFGDFLNGVYYLVCQFDKVGDFRYTNLEILEKIPVSTSTLDVNAIVSYIDLIGISYCSLSLFANNDDSHLIDQLRLFVNEKEIPNEAMEETGSVLKVDLTHKALPRGWVVQLAVFPKDKHPLAIARSFQRMNLGDLTFKLEDCE